MSSALSLLSRLGRLAALPRLVAPSPASRLATAFVTRRTLSTSRIVFAAAVRPPATKTAVSKTGVAKKKPGPKPKKAAPKKKPAVKKIASKKKVAPKKVSVAKKTVPKKSPRVTKAQGPPSRGGGPYMVFSKEYFKNHPTGSVVERARAAGAEWRALSDAEKQPYYAQAASEKAKAAQFVSEYFATVDPALLRRLNRQRKAANKPRIRNPVTVKRPPPPSLSSAWNSPRHPSYRWPSELDRMARCGEHCLPLSKRSIKRAAANYWRRGRSRMQLEIANPLGTRTTRPSYPR
ncbi:hypothetical protein MVEN_00224400 [Mycena venus]|uniref:HMG box domain-containing protein n=1 Tax=Mycena venus TaxID=2733690 RepID=A0A8H7DC46_9AGAR|nr:hypothetical protein MVEN_00224400 [Mycena venus]